MDSGSGFPALAVPASYSELVLYKDEAVVLRTMRLGEADRIVTFLGRANGKIRAVAKGVRKTKSRFGGRLEPFSQVSLVLWRGRSSLDIVTQAEVVEPFRRVRENLEAFALGQLMLEAVDRLVQERERVPRVFTLVVDGLHALGGSASPRGFVPSGERGSVPSGSGAASRTSPSPLLAAWFLLRLSGLAGFAPHLDRCAECQAPAGWFSPAQGGGVCRGCRFPDAEEVGPGMLRLMSDLLDEGAWMQPRAELDREALRLARWYTEFHLERRLRSAGAAETLTSPLQS